MLHFVGFRGEEYWSAVKVWGKPDFYHMGFDLRMNLSVDWEVDTIICANGHDHVRDRVGGPPYSYPDLVEC